MKFIIVVISCGKASMRVGRALRSPSANPFMIVKAALKPYPYSP